MASMIAIFDIEIFLMKFSLLKRICGVAMSETVQMSDALVFLGQWSLKQWSWGCCLGEVWKSGGKWCFYIWAESESGAEWWCTEVRCVVAEGMEDGTKNGRRRGRLTRCGR